MPGRRPIPEREPAPVSLGPRPRILIVKLATLGDLLLALPALRALRTRYPAAATDMLTTTACAPLIQDSPLVDRVFTLDLDVGRGMLQPGALAHTVGVLATLRARHYDAVLLLHHLTRPAGRRKHRALLAAIGARLTAGLDNGYGAFLDLRVPDGGFGARHEAEYALAGARAVGATPLVSRERAPCLADLGWDDLAAAPPVSTRAGSPLIALHPGGGAYSLARRWPATHYAELAVALHAETGARIAVIAGPGEEALAGEVIADLGGPEWACVAAPDSPRALAALLADCALFAGNDAFPMHLAAAAGIPVVAIFGPSNARAWGPYAPDEPERVAVVRRDELPCSPCFYRGHQLGLREGCPPRMCLTALSVERVLAAARRLYCHASFTGDR
jgi:ADP-heptose:LPS heptosyltransferase